MFALALAQAFEPSCDIVWYASVPSALRVAPPGWGSLASFIPLSEPVARVLLGLFVVSSGLAIVGWKTRCATAVALVTGFYVLGVPQFFGKINHNHHLLWFMALLAASPSGDALSLDARGAPKVASVKHGFPLRVAWVLLGFVYFFPGIWKLFAVGPAWALSDNVKYMMYDKWTELGGFLPFWRADYNPLAYRLGGVYTLVFEIGFLPALLFSRKLRPWFVVSGPAFHFQTFLFMKIGFTILVFCYVMFIDWPESFRHRRPVLVGTSPSASPSAEAVPALLGTRAPYALGGILIVGNFIAGCVGLDSYPFTVYPRFARLQPHTVTELELVASDAQGRSWRVDDRELARRFSSSRWKRLLRRLSKLEGPEREESLAALVQLVTQNSDGLRGATEVRIDAVENSIRPDDWSQNPLRRTSLGSFRVSSAALDSVPYRRASLPTGSSPP